MRFDREAAAWRRTWSGATIDFLNPDPAHIHLDDIAVALSRIPRFTGHTHGGAYSVAQHSCHVHQIIVDEAPGNASARLWALLHDAHEAYTGDLPTPLISVLGEEGSLRLQTCQTRLDDAICQSLGITLAHVIAKGGEAVKWADLIALATEKQQLLLDDTDWGVYLPSPDDFEIQVLGARDAERLWRTHVDLELKQYSHFIRKELACGSA